MTATAENMGGGPQIDMIGVPFDGMGRSPGQAGAPEALRAAGLPAAFGPDVVMEPDLALPGAVAQRAAGSGLLNEQALLQMVDALYRRVRSSLSAGRFPFVYGADCSVLLAAVPALRDVAGRAGLVFVDGHEDATPMDLSTSGEAANMEIALLLGLTGEQAPPSLRDRRPALNPGALAMLGPRDHLFRQAANVPTVADRVWLRPADEIAADPAGYARLAVGHVAAHESRWWLHIDLDVLARSEFTACGAPGEVMLAGGLTWPQLTEVGVSAVQSGGCAGWSVSIYNPDLDPDRSAARRIVEFVAQVAPSAGPGRRTLRHRIRLWLLLLPGPAVCFRHGTRRLPGRLRDSADADTRGAAMGGAGPGGGFPSGTPGGQPGRGGRQAGPAGRAGAAVPGLGPGPAVVNRGWADLDRGLFSISVAAELAGLHPQTLRIYEREGLLDPARSSGGTRRDIDRIQEICALAADGLNLAGIRRVLQLQEETRQLQAELARLRQLAGEQPAARRQPGGSGQ